MHSLARTQKSESISSLLKTLVTTITSTSIATATATASRLLVVNKKSFPKWFLSTFISITFNCLSEWLLSLRR